jgi:hypothetical protein
MLRLNNGELRSGVCGSTLSLTPSYCEIFSNLGKCHCLLEHSCICVAEDTFTSHLMLNTYKYVGVTLTYERKQLKEKKKTYTIHSLLQVSQAE